MTGAAGFIGTHPCRRFVADGGDVVAMDELSEGDARGNLAVSRGRATLGREPKVVIDEKVRRTVLWFAEMA